MKKIILILCLFIPLNVIGATIPDLNSTRAIIYDMTDKEILYEQNSEEKISIASLTKIMTALTAIEKVSDLEEQVTITSNMLKGIYWNASVAGLKVGDVVTYKDLLYATLLPSGADATHVLAYSISGGLTEYVEEMNNFAIKLGLTNTHFTNVIGLDNVNHYSTLKDMLTLLNYALENPTFKEVYTTKKQYLTNGLLVQSTMDKIGEKMQLDTSRILGSKTGFTDAAGYCLSSYVNSNNHELILITAGAKRIDTSFYHIIDTLNLITYSDEVVKEKIEAEELRQKELQVAKEQEEKKKQELEAKKQEEKEITMNKYRVIAIVFAGCILLIILCKPKKKRKNRK